MIFKVEQFFDILFSHQSAVYSLCNQTILLKGKEFSIHVMSECISFLLCFKNKGLQMANHFRVRLS